MLAFLPCIGSRKQPNAVRILKQIRSLWLGSSSVPLSRTGTHRGSLTMPSAIGADLHFPPVRVTTGSRQENHHSTGLVIVAFYCLSGDFF